MDRDQHHAVVAGLAFELVVEAQHRGCVVEGPLVTGRGIDHDDVERIAVKAAVFGAERRRRGTSVATFRTVLGRTDGCGTALPRIVDTPIVFAGRRAVAVGTRQLLHVCVATRFAAATTVCGAG